ncbi:hypothetical protein RFI_12447 [Reticulomyxa filosa]|uniref:DNA mismatch repair proteins mutS family domain-containing protein n=1 Tax=Reticulomyxa filosa TaxID=46433 RepID=X6NG11_RETFI|nr:hypothetical protein RFI_12447 [Reticulomyxa filosa]|eukprot:ETO24709.1 hypothetical protein RFI_12447 [Reticulomyxa filosa]
MSDGVAMLSSSIEYFNQHKTPKVLISTHWHELFQYQLIKETPNIAFYQMTVLVQFEESAGDSSKTTVSLDNSNSKSTLQKKKVNITHLYKLVPGISFDSFGLECALSAGLEELLIMRAEYLKKCIQEGEEITPMENSQTHQLISQGNIIAQLLGQLPKDKNTWSESTEFHTLVDLIKKW